MTLTDLREPFARFQRWYDEVHASGLVKEPTAMTLATVSADGQPSVRVVLLKGYDERGFVFYTNLESRKGRDIAENPRVGLCFFWEDFGRQVRVRGVAERVSDEEADAYFASRARESQLGAWASLQSSALSSREELEERFALFAERYPGAVPRPPHWSGLRVVPSEIELWEAGAHRLHHRELYVREGDGWRRSLLFP
jgi:pyridoxamine 5'-phosphate oxidase